MIHIWSIANTKLKLTNHFKVFADNHLKKKYQTTSNERKNRCYENVYIQKCPNVYCASCYRSGKQHQFKNTWLQKITNL